MLPWPAQQQAQLVHKATICSSDAHAHGAQQAAGRLIVDQLRLLLLEARPWSGHRSPASCQWLITEQPQGKGHTALQASSASGSALAQEEQVTELPLTSKDGRPDSLDSQKHKEGAF